MKMKIKKKLIRSTIEDALFLALAKFGLSSSGKIKKIIKEAARDISAAVKELLKKNDKRTLKTRKVQSKKKPKTPSIV